ncbi:MAG: quinoprotein relay system zinc metallohydrolase 1 [Gammaproteobacteria bacterium]
MLRRLLVLVLLLIADHAGAAYEYRLISEEIAPDIHVIQGSTEHFTLRNGGAIVNTAFIVTSAGVVVIDTGPSLNYGRAMRREIERVTNKPIVRVYNTHHHPDHFFGNQAFSDTPILALAATRQAMRESAQGLSDNLYRLLGPWMQGTEPHLPTANVEPGRSAVGDHEFETFAFNGHTAGDLAILDRLHGVLFAGDLVFNDRAATTPNAEYGAWLASLRALDKIDFRILVPGHGRVATSHAPITQTGAYLEWLNNTIDAAVRDGRSMAETLYVPIPADFSGMSAVNDEYRRSVMHWFPRTEQEMFERDTTR